MIVEREDCKATGRLSGLQPRSERAVSTKRRRKRAAASSSSFLGRRRRRRAFLRLRRRFFWARARAPGARRYPPRARGDGHAMGLVVSFSPGGVAAGLTIGADGSGEEGGGGRSNTGRLCVFHSAACLYVCVSGGRKQVTGDWRCCVDGAASGRRVVRWRGGTFELKAPSVVFFSSTEVVRERGSAEREARVRGERGSVGLPCGARERAVDGGTSGVARGCCASEILKLRGASLHARESRDAPTPAAKKAARATARRRSFVRASSSTSSSSSCAFTKGCF